MNPLIEIARFCRRQWYMLLVAIPAVLLFTLFHEAAHALAVVTQGGQVTEFTWLPANGHWGQIRYNFSSDEYSALAISIAPYLMWFSVSLAAILLSLKRRPWPFFIAAFIFMWLYVGPLADIANTAFPYLMGKSNDFAKVFGPPTMPIFATLAVLTMISAIVGFPLQRRLFRQHALSAPAYLLLTSLVLIGLIVGIAGILI